MSERTILISVKVQEFTDGALTNAVVWDQRESAYSFETLVYRLGRALDRGGEVSDGE